MQQLIFSTLSLIFNVLTYHIFICMFTNRRYKKAIAPKLSSPQLFFTDGTFKKISLAIILFTFFTIFVGLYVGTDWIRKWTWSPSTPISKKRISKRFDISIQISLSRASTSSVITILLYFATNTKWYINSDTLWLFRISSPMSLFVT